jgi:hypothetical protein
MEMNEVIQLYFYPLNFELKTNLIKRLIAYKRVHVNYGGNVSASFDINPKELYLVDDGGNLISSPGLYQLQE